MGTFYRGPAFGRLGAVEPAIKNAKIKCGNPIFMFHLERTVCRTSAALSTGLDERCKHHNCDCTVGCKVWFCVFIPHLTKK